MFRKALILSIIAVTLCALHAQNFPKLLTLPQIQEKQKTASTSFNFTSEKSVLTLSYDAGNVALSFRYYGDLPPTVEADQFVKTTIKQDDKSVDIYTFTHGDITEQSYPDVEPTSDEFWQDYLFTKKRRLYDPKIQSKTMNIGKLARYLRSHNVMFYTGAGISMSNGVWGMKELINALGFDEHLLHKNPEKLVSEVVRHKDHICKTFKTFCNQMFFTKATKAHYLLRDISQRLNAPIFTECLDLLHEQSGVEPIRLTDINHIKKTFNKDILKKIDAIVCIGLSHDDRAFLAWYKEQNPRGHIISIDIHKPTYLDKNDYFIEEDLNSLLPKLKRRICPVKTVLTTLEKIWDKIVLYIEKLTLKKDNFYVLDKKKKIYRSRQLTKTSLKYYIKKYGIKTILNLRGENFGADWWEDERDVVTKYNVTWINLPFKGTTYLTLEEFSTLMSVFKDAEYPLLMHCKAGADRTGEACAAWVLTHKSHIPLKNRLEAAKKQLSIKYRHFKLLFPKKDQFIEEFGHCYILILQILRMFNKTLEELTPEQIQIIREIARYPHCVDYAIKAITMDNHQRS